MGGGFNVRFIRQRHQGMRMLSWGGFKGRLSGWVHFTPATGRSILRKRRANSRGYSGIEENARETEVISRITKLDGTKSRLNVLQSGDFKFSEKKNRREKLPFEKPPQGEVVKRTREEQGFNPS